jgi:outer membrane protein assembly factor BamA
MLRHVTHVLLVVTSFSVFAFAQCASDERSEKHGGVVVTDFTINGTTTLDSTELARLSGDFVGSCYNDDSEEMQERLRAGFQEHGYFAAEIKHLTFKPSDPLGTPKPVAVEAEVVEGPKYRLAEITILENHTISTEIIRAEFPLKPGDVFERGKVATGLESLRKLYASKGFLDFTCIPDTEPSSNGTITLKLKVDEGTQYHMGKLEILAGKETAARLRAEWKMAEGIAYDSTYIKKFIEANGSLLPEGFSVRDTRQVMNCPEGVVALSLMVDPREGKSELPVKNIPCESQHDQTK